MKGSPFHVGAYLSALACLSRAMTLAVLGMMVLTSYYHFIFPGDVTRVTHPRDYPPPPPQKKRGVRTTHVFFTLDFLTRRFELEVAKSGVGIV